MAQQTPNTNQQFLKPKDLEEFKKNLCNELDKYITQQLEKNAKSLLERMDSMFKEIKTLNDTDSEEGSTEYDDDHDVIMQNQTYSLKQVPDPGFFTGDTTQTELFCELCQATFKTPPNNHLSEEVKINFVAVRLRESARIWYHIKYKDGVSPITMDELLEDLRKAFSNVTSTKLAKIQLIELRQTYGKINDYIIKFRDLSRCLEIDDTSLSLIFLNGLHPKYKAEIKKSDVLPNTLDEMVTKCIIYENTLITNNKLNINNNSNNNRSHNNNKRNNRRFNRNKNQYQNSNNNYNNNNNNNYVNKVQKINPKN